MQNTMERQWMDGAKVHKIWHITGTYEWWRRNTAHTCKLWWHDRKRWDPNRKSQSESGAGRPGWHILEVPIAIEGRTAIDSGPLDLKTRSTAKLASKGNPLVFCARGPPYETFTALLIWTSIGRSPLRPIVKTIGPFSFWLMVFRLGSYGGQRGRESNS